MKQILHYLICLLLSLFLFSANSLNAQTNPTYYYVATNGNDSNPGTESLPFKTFSKATSMATAGVTVFIRQGIYNERLIPVNSGTGEAPVTFASYPGDTAIITGAGIYFQLGPANDKWWNGMIQIQDLNYIKIIGLRVLNSDASGIVVNGCNYITIEGNYTDSTFSPGIEIASSENITVEGNEVVHACMGGDQECISVSVTNRFEIKNNRVHDGFTEGIDVKVGCSNGIITRNEVYNQRYRFGIYIDAFSKHEFNIEVFDNISHENMHGFGFASEDTGLIESIRVHHNIAYKNAQRGFWFDGGGIGITHNYKNIKLYCNSSYENGVGINITAWSGMNIDSLLICNNLIFHNTEGISTNFEMPAGLCDLKNIEILNNTIFENGTLQYGWGDGGINITSNMPQNLLIRNNILSGNSAYTICVQPDVPADSITIDNNFFDGFRNFLHEMAGTNSVYGSPSFVDTLRHDFHLLDTSACIDKGDSSQQYNDPVDPHKPGYALFPSKGTIRNDMGAFGGPYASYWDSTVSVATPLVPSLASPSNNATGVPHTLLLCWDGFTGATSHRLQVSTSPSFSPLLIDQSGIMGLSYGIRNLANNTLYYWRVNATNSGGTSSYSSTWNFKTSDSALAQLSPEIPIISELFQNYPNPFDQFTSIEFTITEESPVKLAILNSLGIEVEVLVNQTLPPGHYRTKWIPRNNADGDYFCKLQIAEFISTKKLLLLK